MTKKTIPAFPKQILDFYISTLPPSKSKSDVPYFLKNLYHVKSKPKSDLITSETKNTLVFSHRFLVHSDSLFNHLMFETQDLSTSHRIRDEKFLFIYGPSYVQAFIYIFKHRGMLNFIPRKFEGAE